MNINDSSQHTDAVLVNNYINGSELALNHLINRHQLQIFNFINSKINDRDTSEDIFQDTFIKVINSIKKGKYNEEGKFLPWVMRITHNLIIDYFRRESKMRKIRVTDDFNIFDVLENGNKNQEEILIQDQVYSDLNLIIEELPEDQKQVLKMRYLHDMSFKKIAMLIAAIWISENDLSVRPLTKKIISSSVKECPSLFFLIIS